VADLLVTGTDTSVGKTVIAAALLLAFRAKGIRAIGFKPAETGVDPAEPGTADSEILALASSETHAAAAPLLRLPEPLAPAVAASRAGLELHPEEAVARVAALREAGFRVVLEGAGGLLAPLSWGFTMRDLARDLDLSAVIVARAGLGALNHTCLTVEALRAWAVPVCGIVLNAAGDTLAEETNPEALRRLIPDVPVVVVPRFTSVAPLACAEQAAPLVKGLLYV
jgi:dethiobiotin synthetase